MGPSVCLSIEIPLCGRAETFAEESTPSLTCLLEAGLTSLQTLAGIQTENSPCVKSAHGAVLAGCVV